MWTKKYLILTISCVCLPGTQNEVFGQPCYEFENISCEEIVGETSACGDIECEWEVYDPRPPVGPQGHWVCTSETGKVAEDDEVQGTVSILGTGVQYFHYGETIFCSKIYDCTCDHISPSYEFGGNCTNFGLLPAPEDADPVTPVEEGTVNDHDYEVYCSEL